MGSSISGDENGQTEVGTAEDPSSDGCARCGYYLRGVADDAPCPECGLLAERSRQRDGLLSDATPGWLLGIAVGVTLVLLAHAIGLAWFVAVVVAADVPSVQRAVAGSPFHPVDVALAGFDLAALTLVAGVWLVTRPQHAGGRDGTLRWSLRLASLVPIVAIALLHDAFRRPFGGTPAALYVAAVLLTAGVAPIPALSFALLRRLAKRVLDPNLAEHAAIVGVGLSLTLATLPLIGWAMERLAERPAWPRTNDDLGLWMPLLGLVSLVLFGGWSLLNCVRFALAFRRAYRGARHKWRIADRST